MTKRLKALSLVAALVVAAGPVRSEAATISLIPATQTIAVGGTATVDVVVSGLLASETVGGFSFLLSFDGSKLGAPAGYTVGAGMGPVPLDLSGGFAGLGGSPLDMFVLADGALDEPTLKAGQGASFTLAQVTLTGLAEGLSGLTLSVVPGAAFLSNFDGTAEIAAQVINGSVCVDNSGTGQACDTAFIPEPATMSLLGTGLATLFVRRRRQQRQ